eukprot:TRINITY_DN748_c1_g1_i2.p1 TRINITY_DN748_c1_g1~~TRINITY_DN748_c1_g1_i2.p1  ORF type:complete len:190 (-),score=-4.71 TRINITY_DN748_c1_g1_i2:146-715(-)
MKINRLYSAKVQQLLLLLFNHIDYIYLLFFCLIQIKEQQINVINMIKQQQQQLLYFSRIQTIYFHIFQYFATAAVSFILFIFKILQLLSGVFLIYILQLGWNSPLLMYSNSFSILQFEKYPSVSCMYMHSFQLQEFNFGRVFFAKFLDIHFVEIFLKLQTCGKTFSKQCGKPLMIFEQFNETFQFLLSG